MVKANCGLHVHLYLSSGKMNLEKSGKLFSWLPISFEEPNPERKPSMFSAKLYYLLPLFSLLTQRILFHVVSGFVKSQIFASYPPSDRPALYPPDRGEHPRPRPPPWGTPPHSCCPQALQRRRRKGWRPPPHLPLNSPSLLLLPRGLYCRTSSLHFLRKIFWNKVKLPPTSPLACCTSPWNIHKGLPRPCLHTTPL